MIANNTIRLQLLHTAVCRTPAFSPDDKLTDNWPVLKEMIRETSPAFSQLIDSLDAETLQQADGKIRYSVWKYFNRACYRATPFGRFAAISFVSVASQVAASPVIITGNMDVQHLTDWCEKDRLLTNLKQLCADSAWFSSNSTWYRVGDEIRYVKQTNSQFELAVVTALPEINALLAMCRYLVTKISICRVMGEQFGFGASQVEDLLVQMISCQLLLTERLPNITGEDYFHRLNLSRKAAITYSLSNRKIVSGNLDPEQLKLIPEYLDFINDFLPETKSKDLEIFRRDFTRKFGAKMVPLTLAMDPETGVGYGGLAQSSYEGPLSGWQKQERTDPVQFGGPQYQFLLNSLIKGETICLEHYQKQIILPSRGLPNTLSVIFRYWNGKAVIENAGGCTANALLGRFTVANEQAERLGKEIAAIEEDANPGVLFFDVAYQAEKNVDNVNRRKMLYGAELPLLSWSCHPSSLSVGDIQIGVNGDEIILWSNEHQCRIVPRIASAYNYTRSDLAVYRFLCDLQHQGLRSDLSFRLQPFFSGLDHYPRVVYKNLIVSPAMWKIDEQCTTPQQFKQWLQLKKINFLFKCGNADQTLCFNPVEADDLLAFTAYCKQNSGKDIYISEALFDTSNGVKNEDGKPYAAQFIAHYTHSQPVYKAIPIQTITNNESFFPGSKWLYFEIYCHSCSSNELLNRFIHPYLVRHQQQLEKWFFIRYNDPISHIRLRLRLKDLSVAQLLITDLRCRLKSLCNNGLVSDIQIKTYIPETERYGVRRMREVESFFCKDSRYVLQSIKSGNNLYTSTLVLMERLCALAFEDPAERLRFIQDIAESFSRELSLDTLAFKKINNSFESLKKELTPLKLKTSYEQAFCKLITDCEAGTERRKLVADILHMHVNRVFNSEQRVHEAVLYQYLLKLAKRDQHVVKHQPALL